MKPKINSLRHKSVKESGVESLVDDEDDVKEELEEEKKEQRAHHESKPVSPPVYSKPISMIKVSKGGFIEAIWETHDEGQEERRTCKRSRRFRRRLRGRRERGATPEKITTGD